MATLVMGTCWGRQKALPSPLLLLVLLLPLLLQPAAAALAGAAEPRVRWDDDAALSGYVRGESSDAARELSYAGLARALLPLQLSSTASQVADLDATAAPPSRARLAALRGSVWYTVELLDAFAHAYPASPLRLGTLGGSDAAAAAAAAGVGPGAVDGVISVGNGAESPSSNAELGPDAGDALLVMRTQLADGLSALDALVAALADSQRSSRRELDTDRLSSARACFVAWCDALGDRVGAYLEYLQAPSETEMHERPNFPGHSWGAPAGGARPLASLSGPANMALLVTSMARQLSADVAQAHTCVSADGEAIAQREGAAAAASGSPVLLADVQLRVRSLSAVLQLLPATLRMPASGGAPIALPLPRIFYGPGRPATALEVGVEWGVDAWDALAAKTQRASAVAASHAYSAWEWALCRIAGRGCGGGSASDVGSVVESATGDAVAVNNARDVRSRRALERVFQPQPHAAGRLSAATFALQHWVAAPQQKPAPRPVQLPAVAICTSPARLSQLLHASSAALAQADKTGAGAGQGPGSDMWCAVLRQIDAIGLPEGLSCFADAVAHRWLE
uniref:Uncharacterized protein n=1 Tax=Chlamydomonas euryale TaxID=1486919 RepID=A0A7R9Z0T1_9CHLO|mmetsp:Transcript_37762/g.111779  ORF Transcript_37762/g.111779 Transcript_37762/m.111779 type:complete len:567 (+) Transcript_37762:213-1913(+)